MWREAARFALVPYHEFAQLDREEQGAIIAHYQTIKQIEAVAQREQLARVTGRGRRKY